MAVGGDGYGSTGQQQGKGLKTVGLTSDEVADRVRQYGLNEIEEKKKSLFLKFLSYFWGPMPWLIEAAVIISAVVSDWKDMIFLFILLLVNGLLAFYEEFKARNAIDALKNQLSVQAKVIRDGRWVEVPARELVPDDMILLRLGDVAPADVILMDGEPMEVDQAALTGESLPVTKFEGEAVYAGSTIKRGELEARVSATGSRTFFGKAAAMVDSVEQTGHFQLILWKVAQFLMLLAFVMVLVIFFTQVFKDPDNITYETVVKTLKLCLVLLVASIPIAMQVVCTGTMAVGARALAAKNAIVARLSAIEELAGMDVLCSDKTGTLTQNKLRIDTPWILGVDDLLAGGGGLGGDDPSSSSSSSSAALLAADIDDEARSKREAEVVYFAALASQWEGSMEPIDHAITSCSKYVDLSELLQTWEREKFVPFNPNDKRTLSFVQSNKDGRRWCVSKGSPQISLGMCMSELSAREIRAVEDAINTYAGRGYRTLGVARRPLPSVDEVRRLGEKAKGKVAGAGAGAADNGAGKEEGKDEGGGGGQLAGMEGGAWEFLGLVSMFDPPRHDTKETIERAIALGVEVKMITGDHKAIGKDTARRLGMGTNILGTHIFQKVDTFGQSRGELDYTDMVEHADGFAEVFPEHKFLIVEVLQKAGHICGMTGDGVNDAPALKKADIGIAVQGCTDAARAASDIVLTSAGLSTIIDGILLSRQIFQRMKNYCVYRISCTIWILFFFAITICFYDFQIPVFVIVLISLINDGTIITIAYDNVLTSARPEKWDLPCVCGVAICLGFSGVGFSIGLFQAARSNFFQQMFTGLPALVPVQQEAMMYLQLSLAGQLTVFNARTKKFFFSRRPGTPLLVAFCVAQLLSTLIAIYPLGPLAPMIGLACRNVTGFASNHTDYCAKGGVDSATGWAYAGIVWVYCLVCFVVQDCVKQLAYLVFDFRADPNEQKAKEKNQKRINRARADTCQPRQSDEHKMSLSRELSAHNALFGDVGSLRASSSTRAFGAGLLGGMGAGRSLSEAYHTYRGFPGGGRAGALRGLAGAAGAGAAGAAGAGMGAVPMADVPEVLSAMVERLGNLEAQLRDSQRREEHLLLTLQGLKDKIA